MQETIEEIKNRMKNKRSNMTIKKDDSKPSYISKLFTRTLIAIIFLLVSVIYVKNSNESLLMYKEHVLNKNIEFAKLNVLAEKYLGGVLPLDNIIDEPTKSVFNEKLSYKSSEEYHDGLKLNVTSNYAVPVITSGIVVFNGKKENYGDTVIVQGIDGVDIWYGNLTNTNITLYDYVEAGSLLGETNEDTLYLVLQKNGKYISYEEYTK